MISRVSLHVNSIMQLMRAHIYCRVPYNTHFSHKQALNDRLKPITRVLNSRAIPVRRKLRTSNKGKENVFLWTQKLFECECNTYAHGNLQLHLFESLCNSHRGKEDAEFEIRSRSFIMMCPFFLCYLNLWKLALVVSSMYIT